MVNVLVSSAVDRGFEPRSGQTKDYKIGICCFSTKHTALRRKSKDWLARNQNNVSKWSDMSTRRLLFQWANTIKIQLNVLV
jgi:predicted LPLAT superfamily acyltransferase